jgi:Xaa-Pro dipeptidase
MVTAVPPSEFHDRLGSIRARIDDEGVDAGVWFGAKSVEYLSGFDHVATERPVALVVTDERVELVVPRLELDRARATETVDAVHQYFDYPQGEPIRVLARTLDDVDAGSVVADADGAPGTMGYEGPNLSEFVDVRTRDWVGEMREAKSGVEIELIRESARWGNLAHRHLADGIEPGTHPATVSQEASTTASRAMLDALGSEYAPRTRGDGPAHAGLISGPQTALPHGNTANRRLEEGDVVITGASANVDGYYSELERTMFVGEPSAEQRKHFEWMLEAQTTAIEAMGPGVPVAEVDRAVWEYFERQGIADLAQHHVGHNIGLGAHEPPYVDRGSEAVMEPGHVYTIEPGLYTDEAGYRHSDTIAVTEDGIEWLTYYPRDLESNVVR